MFRDWGHAPGAPSRDMRQANKTGVAEEMLGSSYYQKWKTTTTTTPRSNNRSNNIPNNISNKIASRSEPSSMFDGMRDKFVDASRAHTSNHIISSGPPNLLRHGPTGKPSWEYRHTNTTHTAHNAMHVCFFGAVLGHLGLHFVAHQI